MRISYHWLKELLPDLTATPEEVAHALTMHSFETVIADRWQIDPYTRVVKITAIEPHPNADRLRLATVTDGQTEIRVVCGAANISEGDVVPYSPPGTRIKDVKGKVYTLEEATIRGEKSPGMLNSPRELGIGHDHGGILILPPDTPLGSALTEHLPPDVILEADVTPNRAHDSLSHLGLAREVAALLDIASPELVAPALPQAQSEVGGISLAIRADTVARYMGVVIVGTTNGPSPLWMQARLWAMGGKPISRLVDITNYVLFEIGSPSHVFDRRKLSGKKIGVRFAQQGDKLQLLGGTVLRSHRKDLVITDNDRPVALAGVIGGLGTEVDASTTDIFLEVASFQSFVIQETARRYGLRTESSQRFSKGLDPNVVDVAARRLVQLVTQAGGSIVGRLDWYPRSRQPRVIHLQPERISSVAGTPIATGDAKKVLTRLRFVVDDSLLPWNVTIPTDRLDIEGEHDLVEEVIRVVGLENIPASSLGTTAPTPLPAHIWGREAIRDRLGALGFTESMNSAFEPAYEATLLNLTGKQITITNPLAPELARLRASLLPGLLQNAITNREDFHKKFPRQEKALFEIGSVYVRGEGGRVPGVIEEEHVAGILVGGSNMVENVIDEIRRLFNVEIHNLVYLGVLPDTILKKLKYRVPLAAFEINITPLLHGLIIEGGQQLATLEDLRQEPPEAIQYQEFSRYPSVFRDISLLVSSGVSSDQVQEIIERVGGKLVVNTELFDEYQPPDMDQTAQVGLAFHIEYQAAGHTLTDEEVNAVHGKIILALESEINADIR